MEDPVCHSLVERIGSRIQVEEWGILETTFVKVDPVKI